MAEKEKWDLSREEIEARIKKLGQKKPEKTRGGFVRLSLLRCPAGEELLARFVCIRIREWMRIKVSLRLAVASGARPRRI